jgi:hypothetical protein
MNISQIEAITAILLVAALTEAIVEYFVAPIVKPQPVDATAPAALGNPKGELIRSLILRYVAALVAVGLCLAYRVDLLALAGLQPPWPWLGSIVTGLLVGRGSNFINDFAERWLKRV